MQDGGNSPLYVYKAINAKTFFFQTDQHQPEFKRYEKIGNFDKRHLTLICCCFTSKKNGKLFKSRRHVCIHRQFKDVYTDVYVYIKNKTASFHNVN